MPIRKSKNKKPVIHTTKKAVSNGKPKPNSFIDDSSPQMIALPKTTLVTQSGFMGDNVPMAILPVNNPNSGNMNINLPVGAQVFYDPGIASTPSDVSPSATATTDPTATTATTPATPFTASVVKMELWMWILIVVIAVIAYWYFKKGKNIPITV